MSYIMSSAKVVKKNTIDDEQMKFLKDAIEGLKIWLKILKDKNECIDEFSQPDTEKLNILTDIFKCIDEVSQPFVWGQFMCFI